MADHRQLPSLRATAVNIAVTSAHRTLSRTKISPRHVNERFAKSGASCLVADKRREDITLLQKEATRNADRFLPFSEVNAACDHAASIKAGEFLFKDARQQHPAICFQVTRMQLTFPGPWSLFRLPRRLKHQTT